MLDVMATRRVDEDYQDFLDVYSGKTRKELGKFINNGTIWKLRGKNGRLRLTIPRIDIPHIVRGKESTGIGRGPGKPGDVVGKDDDPGQGNQAGQDESEGVNVDVSLEDVLKLLKDDLQLPNLKPKPQDIYEEKKIKYNDISLHGPESLRHQRRTWLQALKRMCASGEIHKLHAVPGFAEPMQLVTPINGDKRYRQYREINIPSSNAVIFFARDGSGSMDQYKCDIVSDMAWWLDVWIRHFYKRTERVYVWHDTVAQEVDENKFYRHRYGGGTTCSSALKLIAKQFEARFPPEKWNIYVFYFTDGENWGEDNQTFCETIQKEFPENVVNLIGITQILPWSSHDSLRKYVDDHLADCKNLKTTGIGLDEAAGRAQMGQGYYQTPQLTEEERDKQITRAMLDLLGKDQVKTAAQSNAKE